MATPPAMKSESGPNMGKANSFINWQNGEPNQITGEHYADMEINRGGRTNGKWNDLPRIPNCNSNGLDCITGYVVEYGGFDSFKLDHDEKDTNNYVRAEGYIEDATDIADKDKDTMLAQLADGEFVSRADAILGAGIMQGADPKDFKEMRAKGAKFFYGQQDQLKRIYDLVT